MQQLRQLVLLLYAHLQRSKNYHFVDWLKRQIHLLELQINKYHNQTVTNIHFLAVVVVVVVVVEIVVVIIVIIVIIVEVFVVILVIVILIV
jgi:hypothetical protein